MRNTDGGGSVPMDVNAHIVISFLRGILSSQRRKERLIGRQRRLPRPKQIKRQ
jgi:hypothetical protein